MASETGGRPSVSGMDGWTESLCPILGSFYQIILVIPVKQNRSTEDNSARGAIPIVTF